MDFERARHLMVETQVRTNDVTDPRLIAAMRRLPRERFATADKASLAYGDLELEVAPGRFMLRPRDLAKLVQALAPAPGERALEIAGGIGYGAALLGSLCAEAIALEPDPELCVQARAALDSAGVANVTCVSCPPVQGWGDGAPYDVIMVSGATEIVPQAWLDQLAEGGRLGVIVREGPMGRARIYLRGGETVAYRVAFDAAPPLIPGLEAPRGFVF